MPCTHARTAMCPFGPLRCSAAAAAAACGAWLHSNADRTGRVGLVRLDWSGRSGRLGLIQLGPDGTALCAMYTLLRILTAATLVARVVRCGVRGVYVTPACRPPSVAARRPSLPVRTPSLASYGLEHRGRERLADMGSTAAPDRPPSLFAGTCDTVDTASAVVWY